MWRCIAFEAAVMRLPRIAVSAGVSDLPPAASAFVTKAPVARSNWLVTTGFRVMGTEAASYGHVGGCRLVAGTAEDERIGRAGRDVQRPAAIDVGRRAVDRGGGRRVARVGARQVRLDDGAE